MPKLSDHLSNLPPHLKIAALAMLLLPISLNSLGDLLTTVTRMTGSAKEPGAQSTEVVMVDRATLNKLSELMTAQTEVLQEIARNTKETKNMVRDAVEEQVTRERFSDFEDKMRRAHSK
jgi:hypothetical protein